MKFGEDMYMVLSVNPSTGHTDLAKLDLCTLEKAQEKADGMARYYATNETYSGSRCNDVFVVAKLDPGSLKAAVRAQKRHRLEAEIASATAEVMDAGSRLTRAQEVYDRAVKALEELEEKIDD